MLLQNTSHVITIGERLGLMGHNGSSTSTLLKILSDRVEPDSGTVSMRRNIRIGYVPQEVDFASGKTAAEVIASGLEGAHLDEFERSSRINLALGRAGFSDGSVLTESLSGGWKRRLAIAR